MLGAIAVAYGVLLLLVSRGAHRPGRRDPPVRKLDRPKPTPKPPTTMTRSCACTRPLKCYLDGHDFKGQRLICLRCKKRIIQ